MYVCVYIYKYVYAYTHTRNSPLMVTMKCPCWQIQTLYILEPKNQSRFWVPPRVSTQCESLYTSVWSLWGLHLCLVTKFRKVSAMTSPLNPEYVKQRSTGFFVCLLAKRDEQEQFGFHEIQCLVKLGRRRRHSVHCWVGPLAPAMKLCVLRPRDRQVTAPNDNMGPGFSAAHEKD